jgi:hypothetical protein
MPGPHPPEFRRRAVELARELDENGGYVPGVAETIREGAWPTKGLSERVR